ncbi:MAG: S8 family peptidase, partial [Gammaproteobacteria bacterium]
MIRKILHAWRCAFSKLRCGGLGAITRRGLCGALLLAGAVACGGGGGGGVNLAQPMKNCPDGALTAQVPEDETCMKLCSGEPIAFDAECLEMKTCKDKSMILSSEVCMKDCLPGALTARIPEDETCMKSCPGSSPVAFEAECPEMTRCGNGDMVLTSVGCRDCPGAGSIPMNQSCPATVSCAGGIFLPEGFSCGEFEQNYGLERINAQSAYFAGAFGQSVTVAVIDSGMRVTHAGLAANIVPGRDFVNDGKGTDVTDIEGHGTQVGGIIAAVRGVTGRPHGVAPQAKLMPLKLAPDENSGIIDTTKILQAMQHAIDGGAKIINNSYGGSQVLQGTYNGKKYWAVAVDSFSLKRSGDYNRFSNSFTGRARALSEVLRAGDVVAVWAAGNEAWSAEGSVILCDNLAVSYAECLNESSNWTQVMRDEFITRFVSEDYTDADGDPVLGFGALADITGIRESRPNLFSLYPFFAATDQTAALSAFISGDLSGLDSDSRFTEFRERWLAVVALDEGDDNPIAPYSNGCGVGKWWCISAPGTRIFTTRAGSDTDYGTNNGTSFAAPHVSGALAVIKSRFPEMMMPVVRAILLTTATPLGDRITTGELDDIYGWGIVNLSAAMGFSTLNISMKINPPPDPPDSCMEDGAPIPECTADIAPASIPLSQARIDLPAALAHLKPQLRVAKAAVSFNGDAYFNMPLSGIAHAPAAAELELGDAAADMLRPQADNRFNEGVFFAATDTKTNQFRYAGAELSAPKFGDWSMRYDFCEDCKKSAWQEWKIFSKDENGIANANIGEEITAPFFAHNEKSFALQMKGEGLRPFASFGEANGMPYEQYGLRLRQNYARFGWQAEASQTNEAESFLGANFGAFGKTSSKTTEGKIALHGDIAKNWRGFAGYSRAKSKV